MNDANSKQIRRSARRRDLVRKSWDALRWLEQRVDGSTEVPKGGFGRLANTVASIVTCDPVVALTFDDGPDPDQTPRLLEILASRGVQATFYLIGANASAHPDLVARIHEEGHELGNHTLTHRFLTTQTASSIRHELAATDGAIADVLGHSPDTLRPPYGAITPSIAGWASQEFNYRTVLWSVDATDWERPDATTIANRIASGTHPGAIVLLHDPVPETIEAVPEVLDRLLERGIEFLTVSALLSVDTKPTF